VPATFAVQEVWDKFEYFGVEEVVLRGGVSANSDYIPLRYGGNCPFFMAGCKEFDGDDFYTAAEMYYDWLVEFVKSSPLIKAVEIINEVFWKRDEKLWHLCPHANKFSVPAFASEPADMFCDATLKIMESKQLHPAYQLHALWSQKIPKNAPEFFAIGEDYCYNELNPQAAYHSHA
jgi:hypothetical protein